MRRAGAVVMLVLSMAIARAQASPVIVDASKKGKEMKQFVLIFRKSERLLSEEEQKQRAVEVRAWALGLLKEGRKLDACLLGEDDYHVGPDGGSGPTAQSGEESLVAITFLEAADFSEAVRIAKTHPGPRYGVSIEVRGWSPPPQPVAEANSPKR